MAVSAQEIARDLVIAWLSNEETPKYLAKQAKAGKELAEVGEYIGAVYTAVLKAVESATSASTSISSND